MRVCKQTNPSGHSILAHNRNQTFRYSTKRLRKATKCSALRMFPGIASFRRSSGSTNPQSE